MEKRRLFIYDRKEVGVLILLGIAVALFAFTLGVHLGKQVVPKTEVTSTEPHHEKPPEILDPGQLAPPNRAEIANEVGNVPAAIDETLDESLRDEVARTGLQVEKQRPLELPETTTAEKKSTPVPAPAPAGRTRSPPSDARAEKPAPRSTRSGGRYALQVGSYKTLTEAEPQVHRLNEQGLRAEIREVNLRDKGKWYRVFVGTYSTISEAEKAGKTFRNEKRIGDFVIVNPAAGTTP